MGRPNNLLDNVATAYNRTDTDVIDALENADENELRELKETLSEIQEDVSKVINIKTE